MMCASLLLLLLQPKHEPPQQPRLNGSFNCFQARCPRADARSCALRSAPLSNAQTAVSRELLERDDDHI